MIKRPLIASPPWTPAEDQRPRDLVLSSKSTADIAAVILGLAAPTRPYHRLFLFRLETKIPSRALPGFRFAPKADAHGA